MCAKNSYSDLISKSISRCACLQGDGGWVKKIVVVCLLSLLGLMKLWDSQKTKYFLILWEYFESEKDSVPNLKYSQYILRDLEFTSDI